MRTEAKETGVTFCEEVSSILPTSCRCRSSSSISMATKSLPSSSSRSVPDDDDNDDSFEAKKDGAQ